MVERDPAKYCGMQFDAFGRPYSPRFRALLEEIEKLPASEQQTKVSVMANELHRSLCDSFVAVMDPVNDLLATVLAEPPPSAGGES